MILRLHWSPDSANLIIRMALEVFELPFEGERLYRGEGDHKSPRYLALNPQGLIPVLEDDDLVLFETGAILLHLCDKMGRFGPEGPAADDRVVRGAFLKWLFYLSNTVHAEMRAMFYSHRYVAGEAAIPALGAGLSARRRMHFDLIESQLPEAGGLLGPVTVLELYLAAMIRWFHLYGQEDYRLNGVADWPRIDALMARVEQLAPVRKALADEYIVNEHPIRAPRRPEQPAAQVTGGSAS
ncbi:glutathione S-transferase family protein [Rhodobacteraceae bacterium NNCM2]|nr:glutathione S-transferase family protein [Coraliihabitans acroporae]